MRQDTPLCQCEQMPEILLDSLGPPEDPAARRALEEHLAGCPACRKEAEGLRSMWAKLGEEPNAPSRPGQAVRLEAFLLGYSMGLSEQASDVLSLAPETAGPAGERGPTVTRRRVWEAIALAACLVLGVGLGYLAKTQTTSMEKAPSASHMLLLYERPDAVETPAHERELVQEYAAWAQRLGREGKVLGGEKLANEGMALAPLSPVASPTHAQDLADRARPAMRLAGFFLVRAADEAEAVAIAEVCPHRRHGGWVELRRID